MSGQIVITMQASELVAGEESQSVLAVEQPLATIIAVAEQGPPGPQGPEGPPGAGGGGEGGALALRTETDDFMVAAEDQGSMILADKATPLIATLPNTLPEGFQCGVAQEGAGAVYFVAGEGASIRSLAGEEVKIAARYGAAFLLVKANPDAAADWRIRGDIATGLPPGAISDEAQQFFDRLATAPSEQRITLYATLIDGLVADGVWAKLDALYIFAAADSATALTNLKQAAFGASIVNSPTFTADRGFNGSSPEQPNVSSNFNALTDGQFWSQNNAAAFGWSLTSAQANSPLYGTPSSLRVALFPKWTDGKTYWQIGPTEQNAVNDNDSSGFFLLNRTAANAAAMYHNDIERGTTSNVGGFVDETIAASLGPFQSAVFGLGASLTGGERTALYGRLTGYLQGVGALS